MDRKLSVLLIEDEPAECQAISNYVETLDDVFLVGITNNVERALEHVKDSLPDAIILDLELHKGGGNGLLFLHSLKELEFPRVPYILVTTNNTSTITHRYARELGSDFIMTKNQGDYSAENVIEFLHSLKSIILERGDTYGKTIKRTIAESSEDLSKRVIKRVSSEIDVIGISPKLTGRKYLIDAIFAAFSGISKNLYTTVAKKYNKSDSSVERAMQNAINQAWRTSDIQDLQNLYTARINSDKGVPTVTEFIYYYANKLKNDY